MTTIHLNTSVLPAIGQMVGMVLVDTEKMPMCATGYVDQHGQPFIIDKLANKIECAPLRYRLVSWFVLPEGLSKLPAIQVPFGTIE